jgi:hypothetical protein
MDPVDGPGHCGWKDDQQVQRLEAARCWSFGGYPLVNIQKAIENDHRNSGFSHEKWWFSIAMLVHQRVPRLRLAGGDWNHGILLFHSVRNNDPNWLIWLVFFRGVETTNQDFDRPSLRNLRCATEESLLQLHGCYDPLDRYHLDGWGLTTTWIMRISGASINGGSPKWMVYNGKSYSIGWFRDTLILGNLHKKGDLFK